MQKDITEAVIALVNAIPKGRVTSYGAIANSIGLKGSARLVGYVLKITGSSVPAHRVVNRNGMLTGKIHFNPPSLMQQLLEREGVKVVDDKICNFDKHFWNPAVEINV
jgi:methylated-DNA-protein-cysteine methyltransferase-like protein